MSISLMNAHAYSILFLRPTQLLLHAYQMLFLRPNPLRLPHMQQRLGSYSILQVISPPKVLTMDALLLY
uniref:Uncharacterized protein n=1 Tax=Arundo donax TaxID=35708 RepID=A0A0A9BZS8_ARUDO